MRRYLYLLIFGLLLLVASPANAQEKSVRGDTKIGLVLSGGGAKGIAHISLLKLIDSLGIRVDYITGTSMGSVVGGLYACGYSGQQIEDLVRGIDWDMLMSNKVEFSDINIEEKDEFGKYLLELPSYDRLKPGLPLGIIEGQGLIDLLSRLTFHVHHIDNFDSLPIPFRCMTADILSGQPVVQKSGYLPLAMRSSMAIPTFFTPVERDTLLLVDGGLVKNFPVEQAQEMGAEFIIGGYTGGKLYGKEEMNSFIKLLYQSASFIRLEDSEKQKELCDIFVNSNDVLADIAASDFNKYDEILRLGDSAARLMLPALRALARRQQAAGLGRVSIVIPHADSICIASVEVKSKVDTDPKMLIGKMGIKAGENYSVNDLLDGVDNVYGTRFYGRVYFNLKSTEIGEKMELYAAPKPPATLKIAFHHDNYQSTGILLNYTIRNFLLNDSRALLTVDFSENPKFRLHYYKFLDKRMRYWISSEVFSERLIINTYDEGELMERLLDRYSRFNVRLNKTINRYSATYVGLITERDFVEPRIDPRNNPYTFDLLTLDEYAYNRNSIQLGYNYNSMNQVYFPEEGLEIQKQLKFIFFSDGYENYYGEDSTGGYIDRYEFQFKPLVKFQFQLKKYIPFAEHFTWTNQFNVAGILRMPNEDESLDYALPESFYLGGSVARPRDNAIQAFGYHEYEYLISQLIGVQSGVQWNFWRHAYLQGQVSLFSAGTNATDFFSNFYKFDLHFNELYQRKAVHELGYGLQLGINTRVGPVIVSANSTVGSPKIRLFWGFGYRLQ
ncbi:MAG: hypothetical protein EP332_10390 [Bacteroidetes bacterium]|nr:MAG: hypothetical protein EP332_10390 [Bacteroidota bacterium]